MNGPDGRRDRRSADRELGLIGDVGGGLHGRAVDHAAGDGRRQQRVAGGDRVASRPVDPVCGMIIDPDSCLVTLERNETRLYFCSEACRDRYCADPHRDGQASTA